MKAIAEVGYLKVIDRDGECHVGFILGKTNLVPLSAHTIPRLELGATVLAVEMAELVQRELDVLHRQQSCPEIHLQPDQAVLRACLQQGAANQKVNQTRSVSLHSHSSKPGRSCYSISSCSRAQEHNMAR